LPQTITGTTIGNTNLFDPSCGSSSQGAPDASFLFTAPATATYIFDIQGSAFSTVLEIRDGDCAGTSLACSGSTATYPISVGLSVGQSVVIIVDGAYLSQGAFTLHIGTPDGG
jgi:hypothetical protein